MKFKRPASIIICCIIIFSPLVSSYAQDKNKAIPAIEKAIGLYKHENYDEALIALQKVRDEEPQSTLAAYYLGLTYKKMQNYRDAVSPLRDAVTYMPKIKGALIELIDCLYQLDRLDEAREWIEEAEKEDIRAPQTAFLKGLVAMKAEDPALAIESFEKAKRVDPSMGEACDYQIGIAHLKKKEYAEARDVFKQVIITDPNSTMANYANEYINAIDRGAAGPTKPWRIEAGEAWEYDTNVVLMPDENTLAAGISDKADSREVTTALAEYNYRANDVFSVRGQYSFYWAKQNNLGFYDTVANSFIVQPTVTQKSHMLSFPIGWSEYFVNDKAYLSLPAAGVVYNYMLNDWNMGQVTASYQYKDYLWGPSIPQENRTSNYLGGSLAWYMFFDKNRGFFNVRYSPNREWTVGNNWNYIGNRATAVLLVPSTLILPNFDRMNLTVSGDAFFENFTRTNCIYSVYRRDQVYTISALASYKFYKDSEIRLQYTYVQDNANITVYDYTRQIYSAGVNFKF